MNLYAAFGLGMKACFGIAMALVVIGIVIGDKASDYRWLIYPVIFFSIVGTISGVAWILFRHYDSRD